MVGYEWLSALSSYAMPLVIGAVGLLMLLGKRPYFDSFLGGAKEGMQTAVRLCPTLILLVVCIRMLGASGALDVIGGWLSPWAARVGIPAELLPLLLTRPFSGSAAMAGFSELLERYGADSVVASCASVVMGSSDTVVYVITVYFSSIGVRRTRYALPVALLVMLFCIFISCFVCRLCLN